MRQPPPIKNAPELQKPLWHVVFVASSTAEKLKDLQENAKTKRLPIIFADFREISGAFHQVDETGNKFKDNAKLKSDSVEKIADKLFKDARINQVDSKLGRWCNDNGFAFDANKMHVFTEDSGFSMPQEIWDNVNKDGVPPKTLKKIQGDGPAVETGPVMNAMMGAGTLNRRTQDAMRKTHPERKATDLIPVKDFSTGVLITLGDNSRETFSAVANNYMMMNPAPAPHGRRDTNYDHMHPRQSDKSAAQLGSEYITKYGPRSSLVNQIAAHINAKPLGLNVPLPRRQWSTNFTVATLHDGMDAHSDALNYLFKRSPAIDEERKHAPEIRPTRFDSATLRPTLITSQPTSAQAEQQLAHVEDMLVGSDAIIMPPHKNGDDDLSRFQAIYDLMSVVVAKQLNPRDANKPVILLNHVEQGKGYWDEAIDLHYDLANQNLTKEYNFLTEPDINGNSAYVKAQSNGYFHVVTGFDMDKLHKAALTILNTERQGYIPRPTHQERTEHFGKPAEKDERFKVAIFCSASCENTKLNESVKNLSYGLAKHDFGIVYGGGDRYTMGSILDGVREYRNELKKSGDSKKDAFDKTYVAGYSTETIAVSETEKGTLSKDLNYGELTKDIYERMGKMLTNSDALVIAPGGAGTVQEWMAAMILHKTMPEQFGHKPIIIYNPKLLNDSDKKVWDVALKTIVGADYNELTPEEQKKRCTRLGIVVKDTIEDVQARIEEERRQWHKTKETGSTVKHR